jgi:hypothetical protein
MKILAFLAMILAFVASADFARAAEKDTRVYEMRVYYAAEGKLDALNARFRDHTVKLFEKHGVTNVVYLMPIENPDRKLIYFLSYPSREAREASWKAFAADPAWQSARKASEVDGKLLTKVESAFMQATDYSPILDTTPQAGRVFELRTYKMVPDCLDDINARFRDHTMKLFEKHGMTNLIYWNLMKDQKEADNTLVYLLAHKSKDAGLASFTAFREDPVWLAARRASEEKAGVPSLTKPMPEGVQSIYCLPTDYSPLK